jgi:phage tail sheath protein FI
VFIADPLGRSPQSVRKVGPAGAVAGLYIFTDKESGPFKAPAGVRATIRGAVALERPFTSAELDQLNSGVRDNGTAVTPVNAIRNLPGAGIISMGARTLLQDGTANRYVNMRRSLIYLNKALRDRTQFAIFENNDERLWDQLSTAITVFLNEYRNQGGLRGATAADAFFVKVDAENNPADKIAQGEVHIEVGVALQYPAEFVIINLSQKTAE